MAKFTFATGNVQALRRIPLYLAGILATFFVPRTDRVWVFGSGIGVGEGALPLYRLARARLDQHTRLVWLATTADELLEARRLGLDAESKLSRRGWWLTMRARVLVVTHGQGDVNRYGAHGGLLVQLWHGIPLKKLHLDSPAALTAPSLLGRLAVEFGHRAVGRQVGIFCVASERVVGRISSAFGVTREQILVSGDPRDDVLLQGTPEHRRADARTRLEAAIGPLADGPVVMYAPTWREGGADPAQPDAAAWTQIVSWLESVDATLVVRCHPLGHGDYAAGVDRSSRVRLLDARLMNEVNPVLAAVDHLVTDYSSIAFDFALTGGTIVFLAADVTDYVESRGLYEPYDAFTGAGHVATWRHALQRLDDLVRAQPTALAAAQAHSRWLRDEYFDHVDGRAGERVLAEILRRTGQDGSVPPDDTTGRRPVVIGSSFADDRLVLRLDARGAPIEQATLIGPRRRVDAELRTDDDATVAEFALLAQRWGDTGLALPSGDYRLVLGADGRTSRVDVAAPLVVLRTNLYGAELLRLDGGLVLRVEAPLADDERGAAAQWALQLAALRPLRRRENAVYFESFYGRTASDNPRAIAAVLAREHPEVRQYWSVVDRSVPVPSGGVPIVEHTREWWRVRAQARLLIVNDWLRPPHHKRRGQHVLQTWHGTMLKRLARDRDVGARTRFAALRQAWRWDALLAQNDYSAQRLRTSYGYRGPIWTTGYPRNDVLRDAGRAPHVRALVGIPEGATVVLYAPTWRDNRSDLIDALDLIEWAAGLPDDVLLLVRGHSRTLERGADLAADKLIDVTTYPDVAELMLVADILVTDYSSVMFDFVSTDRPMIFYTPDLDHYSDVLRGFYFDFVAQAPGPVVETGDDLLAAVVRAAAGGDGYASRRAAWRTTFTPCDDGRAAERVVQRLYDEGWLG